ncbi:hypothetical protein GCM10011583_18670 [Streptomyces camponoticapitis]|uniref:Uncharacterized protein n=1 Tax=Streptomyces camponoticapitis TaxID=1616125 RepID=A0ABQ2E1M8_9ACTN|nr:hypothetical protein GCM10011583_18670 [Streptomyces camponoticapitis]
MVSWDTAVPLAGTSSRTVIEYETLGAVAMTVFLCFPWLHLPHRLAPGVRRNFPIVAPTCW